MGRLNLTAVAGAFIMLFAAVVFAGEYVPGEVIVEFGDNVNLKAHPGLKNSGHPSLDRLADKYDVYEAEAVFTLPEEPVDHPGGLWTWEDWKRVEEKYRYRYFYLLRYHAKADAKDVTKDYREDPYVSNAGPNHIGTLYYLPNDTHFSDQWYLYNPANHDCDIHAPEGWDRFIFAPPPRGKNGPAEAYKPKVAVVDSGIWMSAPNYNTIHDDIKENVTQGRDIINQDDYPEDTFGHGTAVAGIVGARWHNNLGIAGIGKNDTLVMPVKITQYFEEEQAFFEKAAAGGIVWAMNHGADVINMSWGLPPDSHPFSVMRAYEGAWALDISTVAASGNSGGAWNSYPAADERQLMITAGGSKKVPESWERWEYSSWFSDCVDVIAPASPDIYVTWLNNGYKSDEYGTSYAAPMVSAMVAGYRHMLASFGDPSGYPWQPGPGIDYDAQECVEESGSEHPSYDNRWGYGTTYYEKGLDHALEIRPGGRDGGRGGVTVTPAAAVIKAATNAPNPASTATTFRVELSASAGVSGVSPASAPTEAKFTVFDLSGRTVRVLSVPVKGGVAAAAWDLTSANGSRVAPGVYLWRVDAGGATTAKKCVVK